MSRDIPFFEMFAELQASPELRLKLAGAAVLALAMCRRPLAALGGFGVRSGLGLVFLWLFRGVGTLLGVNLGVNLLNGLVLGALGLPGFALLLMAQWVGR